MMCRPPVYNPSSTPTALLPPGYIFLCEGSIPASAALGFPNWIFLPAKRMEVEEFSNRLAFGF